MKRFEDFEDLYTFLAIVPEDKVEALRRAIAHAKKYPETAKLARRADEIIALQKFLDWCEEGCEPSITLTDAHLVESVGRERELLVYRYFGIDPVRLEDEKRAIEKEKNSTKEK